MSEEMKLPFSPDCEKAILGSIILDSKQLATALCFVRVEDFVLSSNREILRTMIDLDQRGITPDLVTIVTELDQTGKLGSVGGHGYVSSLIDGVPEQAFNTEAYAGKIRDLARARQLHAAARLACNSIEAGQPIDDVLGRLQQSELELIRSNARGPRSVKEIAHDWLKAFDSACAADGPDIRLSTSLVDLDDKTGGLQRATLVIVGGIPGGGKSALIEQMALTQAKAGCRVYFASLEMTENVVLNRGASMLTGIPYKTIDHPRYLSREQRLQVIDAVSEIQSWPIVIDDSSGLELYRLIANCRAQINRGCEVIYIDYLQTVGCREHTEIRHKVAAISGALRDLAKTSSIPVVAACQLRKKDNENERPTLFDFAESGAIAQDASVALAVYRPKDGSHYTGEDEILVLKQRNGTTGPVPVTFMGAGMKFVPRYVEYRDFPEVQHQEQRG